MELEYKDEYVETVARTAYYHIVTTGVVVSVIIGVVASIVIALVFRITNPLEITLYTLLIVVVPLVSLSIFVASKSTKLIKDKAKQFADAVEGLSRLIGSNKIELLETPPPPYVAVIEYDRFLVAVSRYSDYDVINILDPIKVNEVEGYAPIFIKKKVEKLAVREIEGRNVHIYKSEVVLPKPLSDNIYEGLFQLYEIPLRRRSIDELYKVIDTVIKSITSLR